MTIDLSIYYSNPCSEAKLRALFLPNPFKQIVYKIAKPTELLAADALRNSRTGHQHFDMHMFLKTKSVFVHIPKSAGRSIRKSLYSGITCSHTTSYWYTLALSSSEISRHFIYTIVRNPWSRLHSAYYFLKNGGAHSGDQQVWDRHLSKYSTFKEFVLDLPYSIEALQGQVIHLRPMHYFIEIYNNINILDYVGYYEDLQKSYSHIAKHIMPGSKSVAALSHENKTAVKTDDYQAEFSGQMIEIVGSVYHRDIRLFGYTFDSFSRENAAIDLGSYRHQQRKS
jgi:hypothetical protein